MSCTFLRFTLPSPLDGTNLSKFDARRPTESELDASAPDPHARLEVEQHYGF
jgi:hypothetical protein